MGRLAGGENWEPSGEAYLRVLSAVQDPDCRFASGKPIMSRVSAVSGVSQHWVKLAWFEGWKGDCVEEVTWTPISKRVLNAQMQARANAEDSRSAAAEKAREDKEKAEKQAAATLAEELQLTTAARKNVMVLTGAYQQLLMPMHQRIKEVAAVFAAEALGDLSVDDLLARMAKLQMLAKGLNTLTADAMRLERQRVGDPNAFAGAGTSNTVIVNGVPQLGGGGPGAVDYPTTAQEAVEHILTAQRAVKRAMEKGLVTVGADLSSEVASLLQSNVLDEFHAGRQTSQTADEDDDDVEPIALDLTTEED